MSIPVVRGTLRPVETNPGYFVVEIVCPFCGRNHTHGAGLQGAMADGHRPAQCLEGEGQTIGYYVHT